MIKKGSKVELLWVGDEISHGYVTQLPRGTGDFLHIKIDGKDTIINPYSLELCQITEITGKDE